MFAAKIRVDCEEAWLTSILIIDEDLPTKALEGVLTLGDLNRIPSTRVNDMFAQLAIIRIYPLTCAPENTYSIVGNNNS